MHADAIEMLTATNKMLELFYKLFYTFDSDAVDTIGNMRKDVVKLFYAIVEDKKHTPQDCVLAHQSLTIAHKVFCLTGPYLTLAVRKLQK